MVDPARYAVLNRATYNTFAELDQKNNAIATYIWVDTLGACEVRGKCKILDFEPTDVSQVPPWDVATPDNIEDPMSGSIIENFLEPVAMYPDPFLRGKNILVLCETFETDGKPSSTNHRNSCKKAMDKAKSFQPWFGIEQEFILVDADGEPLGWPKRGLPNNVIGPSHSGAGGNHVIGRHIIDSHMRACMYAGLKIFGSNAEALASQWEYQIGPCEGIEAADHLWVARYLLSRMAEEFGVDISMAPKPVPGQHMLGSGAHCNFSTTEMRSPSTGMKAMEKACQKLSQRHTEHLAKYDIRGGEDNKRRLTANELKEFTWGIGTRNTSVRIPGRCSKKGYGYIEDRRPSADADPYSVTEMLVRTVCLDDH